MIKSEFLQLIGLYNLADTIDAVRIYREPGDTKSMIHFVSPTRTIAGVITTDLLSIDEGVEFGIANTKKLKKLLSPLCEDKQLSLTLEKSQTGHYYQLTVNDTVVDVSYILCELAILPKKAKITKPSIDLEFTLNQATQDILVKSINAIEADKDVPKLFTLKSNKNSVEWIIGNRKTQNSNKIKMKIAPSSGALTKELTFNADYLKDIIQSTGWMLDGDDMTLSMSNLGFATTTISNTNTSVEYNLIQEKLV